MNDGSVSYRQPSAVAPQLTACRDQTYVDTRGLEGERFFLPSVQSLYDVELKSSLRTRVAHYTHARCMSKVIENSTACLVLWLYRHSGLKVIPFSCFDLHGMPTGIVARVILGEASQCFGSRLQPHKRLLEPQEV